MSLKLKSDGYAYISEKTGREYDLLEGIPIGNKNRTSDICIIFDFENDIEDSWGQVVGFFWGASEFETDLKETEDIIKRFVDKYEIERGYIHD